MTLQFAGTLDRIAIVRAAELVSELVIRPEIANAWAQESACAGMSVGGLTRHLVSQPVNVVALLGEAPSGNPEASGSDADDLATSVKVPTPDFDAVVLDPVFRLLTALSVRRHGQDALVRTLTRPQRAPANVSAF